MKLRASYLLLLFIVIQCGTINAHPGYGGEFHQLPEGHPMTPSAVQSAAFPPQSFSSKSESSSSSYETESSSSSGESDSSCSNEDNNNHSSDDSGRNLLGSFGSVPVHGGASVAADTQDAAPWSGDEVNGDEERDQAQGGWKTPRRIPVQRASHSGGSWGASRPAEIRWFWLPQGPRWFAVRRTTIQRPFVSRYPYASFAIGVMLLAALVELTRSDDPVIYEERYELD
jgi:hypothetical protein